MWILPKSLISAFAPGTEALTSDSVECSQTCAQSLIRRSKPSQSNSFLREWKAGNLTRLRSGAISRPSLGQSFLGWWTSSLAAIPASHSAAQASASEQKTNDIFGPTSQAEFVFSSPGSASSRTLRDTSRWDSPPSSAIWKRWVTTCRSEYSQRLKQARLTSASECSSVPWPTPSQRDYKGACASRVTPEGYNSRLDEAVIVFGQAAPENPSTTGSRPESWATPRAGKTTDENPETWALRQAKGDVATMPLGAQVQAWATPQARDWKEGSNPQPHGLQQIQLPQQARVGKLNPRWVETLMGLPIGWTMPSCQSPVTTALTSCAFSETE